MIAIKKFPVDKLILFANNAIKRKSIQTTQVAMVQSKLFIDK